MVAALSVQLAASKAENKELLLRIAALMEVALPAEVQLELREAAAADRGDAAAVAAMTAASSSGAGSSSSSSRVGFGFDPAAAAAAAAGPAVRGVVGGSGSSLAKRVDAAYFDSYSYFDIHHEMLSDKVGLCGGGGGG
jgi:protein arginine N-methyltransferase 3